MLPADSSVFERTYSEFLNQALQPLNKKKKS